MQNISCKTVKTVSIKQHAQFSLKSLILPTTLLPKLLLPLSFPAACLKQNLFFI